MFILISALLTVAVVVMGGLLVMMSSNLKKATARNFILCDHYKMENAEKNTEFCETRWLPLSKDGQGCYYHKAHIDSREVLFRFFRGSEKILRENPSLLKEDILAVMSDTKKLAIRHGNYIFLVPFACTSEIADILVQGDEEVTDE